MSCPRCQGLIVRDYWEERCVNCGHRTNHVPPPSANYRPLPEGFAALPLVRPRPTPKSVARPGAGTVQSPAPPQPKRRRVTPEERREKKRRYMRDYMRAYNARPGVRERANAAHRRWKRRIADGVSAC